jgi:hypothetical protein
MAFLTDDKILDCIKEYINDNKSRYAILLDGEWGSGKTYFVKKILIPSLEEDEKRKKERDKKYIVKKIIYISLYGISSSDDIMKQLWLQTIQFKENWLIKKVKPYTCKTTVLAKTVLIGGLSHLNVKLPKIDYGKIVNLDKCILCLDDLERCNMNINEVLGYINNFVEHNGVKTIIVANEREVGKLNITSNLELKYLLALQDKIDFPDRQSKQETLFSENTSDNKSTISVDEISSRVEYLFGENFLYNQIKEKLIGFTIYYRPDIVKMLEMLVKEYISDNSLKKAIITSKEFISVNLQKYNHTNLRTLLFSFEKFRKIGEVIKNCNLDEDFKRRVLQEVYQYCFTISIKVKRGEKIPDWSDGSEYGTKDLSSGLSSYDFIFGFKFVDEYIINSNFEEDKIINSISRYCNDALKQADNINDPLNILRGKWWILEDNVLLDYVNKINDKLRGNAYDFSLYTNIITLYLVFQKIGLDIKVDEVVTSMKMNITNWKEDTNIEFDTFGVYVDEDIREIFNSIINELSEITKQTGEKTNTLSINSCFDNLYEWSAKFYQYVNENREKIIRNKKFFCIINIDKLFECIKQSNSADIIEFRRSMQQVYDFSNFKDYFISDYDNMKVFTDKVKDFCSKGKVHGVIITHNLMLLQKQLENYLKNLVNK